MREQQIKAKKAIRKAQVKIDDAMEILEEIQDFYDVEGIIENLASNWIALDTEMNHLIGRGWN